MKRLALALIFVLSFTTQLLAVGTCVPTPGIVTSYVPNERVSNSVTVMAPLVCTADSGGTISYVLPISNSAATPSATNPFNLFEYFLYQVGRTPGGLTGSPVASKTAPSASYTCTITDNRMFNIDLALLTSNGSATVAQLNAITDNATTLSANYPTVRSALTMACTGLGSGGVVLLDLIFKAY